MKRSHLPTFPSNKSHPLRKTKKNGPFSPDGSSRSGTTREREVSVRSSLSRLGFRRSPEFCPTPTMTVVLLFPVRLKTPDLGCSHQPVAPTDLLFPT